MRQSWISLGVSSLIVLSATSLVPPPVSAANASDDVVAQINAIRIENGLAPLIARPQLTISAQSFAVAMAAGHFFGHVGLDGSTLADRDEAAGYVTWTSLEENIAAGQDTAAAVVNSWLQSPTHRANILSPRVTETGVGHVYVAGSPFGHYWVQEFGSRSTSATQTPLPVATANTAHVDPRATPNAAIRPLPSTAVPPSVTPTDRPAPPILLRPKIDRTATPVTSTAPSDTIAPTSLAEESRPVTDPVRSSPANLKHNIHPNRCPGSI